MKFLKIPLFGFLLCLSPLTYASPTQTVPSSSRFVVHLLDYIAQDYSEAVQNGKVVNSFEYDEMLEFSESVAKRSLESAVLKNDLDIQKQIQSLQSLIFKKASPEEVAKVSRNLQMFVVQKTGIQMAPSQWPNLAQGQTLFQKNCTSCHGNFGKGDGPLSKGLNPQPTNFSDEDHMASVSPFKAFNTIRLGIPGTGMQGYGHMTDKEIWDLAFYLVSLRYQDEGIAHAKPDPGFLKQVASSSDEKLFKILPGSFQEKQTQLKNLRLSSASLENNQFIALAHMHLNEALNAYEAGNVKEARNYALLAYLDGVEPIEPKLKANDPSAVMDIESSMGAVRSAIESKKPFMFVAGTVDTAKQSLKNVESILSEHHNSAKVTFFLTLGIILREALEALLIIIALLAIIHATGANQAAAWVHAGWILALGVGVIAWFSSGWLMAMSGAQREILEGVISLVAVGVLLYLGFWMHRQSHIRFWKKFIEERVKTALQSKNLMGLFLFSFIAVFREVFETVLFLRAVWIETSGGSQTAMLAGFASSAILVAIMSIVLLRFSTKLPLQKLFGLSAGVLVGLSVILTGKGLHALQESGWISITQWPINIRWDLFGVYPTFETLFPQIFVAVLCISFWVYDKKIRSHI